MKLANYISRISLGSTLLVLLILMGIQLFVGFVNEVGDMGKGQYDFLEVMMYVPLTLPHVLYQYFPMAALVGSLVALGTLASRSEIIAMRAAGVSIKNIAWGVIRAIIMLMIVVTVLGEYLAPELQHYAKLRKVIAQSGGQALAVDNGLWVRDGNDFIRIGHVKTSEELMKVTRYHFNEEHQLLSVEDAAKVVWADHTWQAYEVKQSQISTQQMLASTSPSMVWDMDINKNLLGSAIVEPLDMSLKALSAIIRDRVENKLQASDYQLIYWQRLIQPLTTIIMVLLAIPFIFGPLRSTTVGVRILSGILIGLVFHLLNKFFGPLILVYQLPPFLAAILPTLLFAIVAYYLMRRIL